MYVAAGSTSVELIDSANFKEFYLDANGRSLPEIADALENVNGGIILEGYAWIARPFLEAALSANGGVWQAPFENMVAYADSKGWVSRDADLIFIRAHIVNAATN